MVVIQCSLDVIHSGVRHSAALENFKPFLCRLLSCNLFYHPIELDSVLDPITICHETTVRFPLGMTQSVTEDTEKSIIASAKKNVAVKSLVASVWNN